MAVSRERCTRPVTTDGGGRRCQSRERGIRRMRSALRCRLSAVETGQKELAVSRALCPVPHICGRTEGEARTRPPGGPGPLIVILLYEHWRRPEEPAVRTDSGRVSANVLRRPSQEEKDETIDHAGGPDTPCPAIWMLPRQPGAGIGAAPVIRRAADRAVVDVCKEEGVRPRWPATGVVVHSRPPVPDRYQTRGPGQTSVLPVSASAGETQSNGGHTNEIDRPDES